MSECVLVTGGTGFLGKHLVDSLVRRSYRVRALDFRPLAEPEPLWKGTVDVIEGDIRRPEVVEAACRGVKIVYHLAAIPSIARAERQTYWSINAEGTRQVLSAAKAAGARQAIHVSSSTVYGIPRRFPLCEEEPLAPIGKYGRSKLAAEEIARQCSSPSFPVSIVRPRVIMGAGRMGIFGLLFQSLLDHRSVYMIGRGDNRFQFTDVEDMNDALLRLAGKPWAEVFNIGAEEIGTVREDLQGLIAHAGSRSRLVPLPAAPARWALQLLGQLGLAPLMNEQFLIADRDFKLDTAKAQRLLGWRPSKTNLQTLIAAFDWYRDHRQTGAGQYRRWLGVLGRFRHSQQGGFQRS